MFETLRKVMLFGLGAAAMTQDKIQQMIDDMVSRGDMTVDEGRKLFDEVTSRVEEQGRTMNERIRNQVRDMLKDMGIADRTQIAMLEARIDLLEGRINDLSLRMPQPEATEG